MRIRRMSSARLYQRVAVLWPDITARTIMLALRNFCMRSGCPIAQSSLASFPYSYITFMLGPDLKAMK